MDKNKNSDHYSPKIKITDIFHMGHIERNTPPSPLEKQIQSEKEILSNGTFEKRFQKGELIESISIIDTPNEGWIETRFNSQGDKTCCGEYKKDGVPTKIELFNDNQVIETTYFEIHKKSGLLVAVTFNPKKELVRGCEYDENYQIQNSCLFENGEVIETKETRMHPEGVKVVRHEFMKRNEVIFLSFNQQGECIGNSVFIDGKIAHSTDLHTDPKTGLKYVTEWNQENSDFIVKNVVKENICVGKYIYKNKQYIGFIECIYDSTPNRYEVFFDPHGNKISCSTYNEKNELIERGVYDNGIYKIKTQNLPSNDDSKHHTRS